MFTWKFLKKIHTSDGDAFVIVRKINYLIKREKKKREEEDEKEEEEENRERQE